MKYLIRKSSREDCKDIAHLITIVWNETYRGIVSDNFLNKLYENEDERSNNLYEEFNDSHMLLLVINGRIVGFVNVGESSDENYDKCGEVYALYVLSKYHGQGYGKKLFLAGVDELKNMGYSKMLIGCLAGNLSNSFYKHMGGIYVKTRLFEKLQLPENVYYFENI